MQHNNQITGFGPQTQSRNRNRSSVTTREKVTWQESDNITEITVLVTATGVPTANSELDTCVAICFNAVSDAVADLFLTETDTESDDVQHELVKIGVPRTFTFSSPVTRADFLRLDGSDTLRVHLGAH